MALSFTDEQTTKLLDVIGAPADTTDPEAVLAVIEDLAKSADGGGDGGTPKGDPAPSELAASAKRVGLEVLDADTLTALRADAAEGRQIKAAAAKAKIEGQVDDAIKAGKITPARRKHWFDLISADPGMADVLASVPAETAVPISEIGHSTEAADEAAEWFR